MTETAAHKIAELVDNFSLFDDWEERYRYLIDLGKTLPAMHESLRTDSNLVRGCTSKVWMESSFQDGVFHFQADSDAHIVRGLIAILSILYQGRTADEIAAIDIRDVFSKLGLEQNLSPSRRNGFFSMVERIRAARP